MDGIPSKAAVRFLDTFESCMVEGALPAQWKRQMLALLPYPSKPLDILFPYRPIYYLDIMGNILERVIYVLYNRLLPYAKLADQQFGFWRVRSIVDAIAMVVDLALERSVFSKFCAVVTDIQSGVPLTRSTGFEIKAPG